MRLGSSTARPHPLPGPTEPPWEHVPIPLGRDPRSASRRRSHSQSDNSMATGPGHQERRMCRGDRPSAGRKALGAVRGPSARWPPSSVRDGYGCLDSLVSPLKETQTFKHVAKALIPKGKCDPGSEAVRLREGGDSVDTGVTASCPLLEGRLTCHSPRPRESVRQRDTGTVMRVYSQPVTAWNPSKCAGTLSDK